jgi:predicted membrane channel-forming protein YqfA (hemolysin III family)
MADKTSTKDAGKAGWIIYVFAALTILIILFGLAFLVSGREIVERPILIFFLLLAWMGLLSGIALGRSKF